MTIDPIFIDVALSAVSLIGMAMVSRHETRFIGFSTCLVGNILWIGYGLIIDQVSYIILFSGYFIFNAIGMHDEYSTWRKLRSIIKRGKHED